MRTLTILSLVVPIVLQSYILRLLHQRNLRKELFWFFLCSAYGLLEAVSRLAVFGSEYWYFWVYWITSLGGIGFTALALWESFQAILWLETRQDWFRWIFWTCLSVVVIYETTIALFFSPLYMTRFVATVVDLEIGQDYLIIALASIYFGLIRFFKVIGHQRESTIIWGFGANAVMSVLGFLIRSVFVTKFFLFSLWLPAIGYIVAELAWIRALRRDEEKVPEPEISVADLRFAMGYYTQLLYRYLGKNKE